MPRRHVIAAVVVAVVWGVNFVVIHVGLEHFPPLLFAALRFALVAVAAPFVPRPAVPARWLVAIGLLLAVGQFGLLFMGMDRGMPAGLASLVLQLQAAFTVGLAVLLLGERPRAGQLAGGALALGGIAVIAAGRAHGVPLVALVLTVGAAASWGCGNVCTRHVRSAEPLGLLVWSSLVAPVPLLALSLLTEGPHEAAAALSGLDAAGVLALLYVVILSTFGGFGVWTALMARHPASQVAPFTLLVPVAGIATAWIALGEVPGGAEVAGAVLVLGGLALTVGLTAPLRGREARRERLRRGEPACPSSTGAPSPLPARR